MNLPSLSIRRPITVIMVILSVILIGSVSLSKLQMDLLPNLNMPIAVATAKYRGAGPLEIETLITKPFEEVLTTVSDLKSIETVSTSEYSLSILYFNEGTDMNFATLEMREKIDLVKTYLPEGVTDIMIMRIDPNNFQSTLELGISADMDMEELTRLVEDQIINKLERINGVAAVSLSGGVEQQISIELNAERLSLYGIGITDLAQYLATENLNIPAGQIETSGMSLFIRTHGEFTSMEDIKNLSVPTATGGMVLLKELADVRIVQKEKTSESYINGRLSLSLSIQKQSNANTVMVCKNLRDEIKKLQRTYGQIHFNILYDSSTYIGSALQAVKDSVIQGGILAALILFLFLRNLRATLIIAISMPVSIITTFVLMYFSGIKLNLISLAGLALGIGMLVDNSIVVLENIYRHRREGMSLKESAETGTKEVMLSVTASTFTTVIVFLPIAFIQGLTGQIFKEMGLTITYSLLASLIIAVTFIPMAASKLLSIEYVRKNRQRKPLGTRIFDMWERFYQRVCRGYEKLLRVSIRKRAVTLILAFVIFGTSLLTLPAVGLEYFPAMDEGIISVELTLPKGSALSQTHDMAFEAQNRIQEIPEVKEITMNLGNGGFVLNRSTTEKASLSVFIGSKDERKRTISQIAADIRNRLSNMPGAKIKVGDDSRVMGFYLGTNEVDIRITGEDMDTLKRIAADLLALVKSIKGIEEAESNIEEEIQEVSIKIHRDKALLYGLTTAQVGQIIQAQIKGLTATRFKYNGTEIDIVLMVQKEDTNNLKKIQDLKIQSPRGMIVPLNELADITLEKSPPNIMRKDQKRTVSITASLSGRALNKVTEDFDRAFASYEFPEGYSYSYSGQQQDLFDSFRDLKGALILSVFIVYMLLAAQFESLLHPLTILLSVPLALTGALLSLFITGKNLSIPAFIGIIILVGLVVDNAIVLIDTVNRFRQEGLSKEEALVRAGPLRLRPILMTTLTTILGMLPMALSRQEGSEIQVPLAIVVMGGLSLSTLVTLIVIPSVYLTFENLMACIKSRIKKKISY